MNQYIKQIILFLISLSLGIILTLIGTFDYFLPLKKYTIESNNRQVKDENPLYWVAPMDANYRRNKPGKSPMGMDLIPVYKNNNRTSDEVGIIEIRPHVINNLGVRTAIVQRKTLQSQIKTVGYVKYDEDQLVHIHPRVEGWIEKLYIKAVGDPVEKGEPLYQIYSPALVNAQEEFVLAIDRKNQRLIRAAEEKLKSLQLPATTLNELKKSREVKQNIIIYAPQSGVIDNLNIRDGFFVKPDTTLMSIGNLEQVWVEAEIFERQAFQVNNGTLVTMSLDFLPGKSWQGKVDYIYPTLDPKNRTLKVRLRFENNTRELKPNMFAQVTIHTASDNDVLLVPREALIRTGGSNRVVLALGDGRFQSKTVELGRFNDHFVEISSGLNEGQNIVTSAQFLLDSESNKSAGFQRMDSDINVKEGLLTQSENSKFLASTQGSINHIKVDERIINISRNAIEKWGREAATMDFKVKDNIDLSQLKVNMKVHFTFQVINNEAFILVIKASDELIQTHFEHRG